MEAGREPGSFSLPLAPAEARALGALRTLPVQGSATGLSLAGLSGVGLRLRTLRSFGVFGPGHSRLRLPAPSVFRCGARLVHQGCLGWTPTPPPLGRRTPRPGSVRVCVCVLFLAGPGRLASLARFAAPQPFLWPISVLTMSTRPRLGDCGPFCRGHCVPLFSSSFSALPVSALFSVFRPGVPGALTYCCSPPLPPPTPPSFFAPLLSQVFFGSSPLPALAFGPPFLWFICHPRVCFLFLFVFFLCSAVLR